MRWSFWALVLVALGGCAGMDEAECRTADWRAIGYEDGAQGRGPEAFGARREACAEHGITAGFDAYFAGRVQGLAHFCHPHNGYRLGTRGYQYTGVCPAGLEPAFLAAHADGYGLYERQAVLDDIRKRLKRSRRRADKIEHHLAEATALLVSPEVEGAERAALAVDLKQLTEERVRLESLIARLESDYARVERDFERYRAHLSARPGY